MARVPRQLLVALLAAMLTLFAAQATAATAEAKGPGAKRAIEKGAAARVSVSTGRALPATRCPRRIASSGWQTRRLMQSQRRLARGKPHLTRGQRQRLLRKERRRLARLARRCERGATGSTASLPMYWGAAIGEHLTGTQAPWDMNAVASFEALAGKRVSLIHFLSPFANCASSCWYYDFPTEPMQSIRDHGAIPFFSWSSQSIPSTLHQPDFQLGDVIAGAHDSYIRGFAEDARDWGHPFFLRFNWEMNGNWFPWSEGVNGNRPGEYVAAWRHVRDIFAEVGAGNATWVWCPNVDPEGRYQDLRSLYPGDAYVDWTCLDGYNWGTQPGAQSSRLGFEQLFGSTYREIAETIAPGKPMAIGETGASERSGDKADWIADMLRRLPTDYRKIRALAWFEKYDDGMDWPLTTSASASAAFAGGIRNGAYRANHYAGLSVSPIPPPS